MELDPTLNLLLGRLYFVSKVIIPLALLSILVNGYTALRILTILSIIGLSVATFIYMTLNPTDISDITLFSTNIGYLLCSVITVMYIIVVIAKKSLALTKYGFVSHLTLFCFTIALHYSLEVYVLVFMSNILNYSYTKMYVSSSVYLVVTLLYFYYFILARRGNAY